MAFYKSSKIKLALLFLIMSVGIAFFIYSSSKVGTSNKPMPKAVNGVLDLRNWDLREDGVVKLDGHWEYYDNQLLTPQDFASGTEKKRQLISIPGVYANQGYGTLRLKLLLKPSEHVESVKIEFLQSAYKLWANNHEAIAVGIPGSDKANMQPRLRPGTGTFSANSDEIYLTLQVCNYYSKLGLIDTIILGDEPQIHSVTSKQLAFDLFLFGSTMMTALFNLGLYFKRRKNKSTLYSAVIAGIVAVRTLFMGERFIYYIFPEFSHLVSGKILLWTFYLYIPFIILFIQSFYNKLLNPWIVKVSNWSAVVYAVLILFSPEIYYMDIVLPFEVLTILLFIYTIYKTSGLYLKNSSSDYLMVIGLYALLATRLNDILYEYSIIITGSFAPFGTLIFIIANSYLLAERQSLAFNDAEAMSEKLNSINNLKDEFLAVTSHELKTPLNGIIGLSEILNSEREGRFSEDEKQSLSLINTSAKRLANLVNDITVFSKLKNGDIKLNKKAVDIGRLAEIVVKFCSLTLNNKNITIINLIDDKTPLVFGDEERIEQILFNLVGNSVKFTSQGTITISCAVKGDLLEVCIQDTGIGIPEHKLKSIFEIYEQVEGVSEKYGGTGLGLYITRKLVELHDGNITVESAPGKGSLFKIMLPICRSGVSNNEAEDEACLTLTAQKASGITGKEHLELEHENQKINKKHKILIVDDEYVNQRILERYLSRENYITFRASTGGEALKFLEKNSDIDLVILDMMMPDMLGCEVSSVIRQKYSLFELPILIMTANGNIDNLVLSFEYGANDYLSKPFNQHELLARVSTLTALKDSAEEAISLAVKIVAAENKVEQLEENDKLKTELFTNLSHELRTPLNVICSTIQLLGSLDDSKQLGDEKIKYYLSIMRQNSVRLLRLINNIIDMTKLDGNHLTLNLANQDIVYVLEDICQSVAEYIKAQDIEIIFDTELEEKLMAFDEEKFERIILNILSNAVKFTDKGGSIFVNVYDRDDFIEISIKDTGIGIPEDKLDFVFERFAQLDKSLSRNHEGSGIGLSLVKSLVEMHGGEIYAKSSEGEGTEFIILLPVRLAVEKEVEGALVQDKEARYEKNLHMEFSDIYM